MTISYVCSKCGHETDTEENLDRHIARIHEGKLD